ncbi:MAG: hypothetical protein WBB69_13270 [Anaerolineales bacterium]
MKRKLDLILLLSILLTTVACTFSGILQKVFGSGGGIQKAPDIVATEISLPEDQAVTWSCTPNDLSSYLGDAWQHYPQVLKDLRLDLRSSEDTLTSSVSFVSNGTFLVDRDDDYRPPPGATLVPEGEYRTEEKYQGTGTAERDGYNYLGKITVDYQYTIFFPNQEVQTGSLEFLTVGYLSPESEDLQICFDVYSEQYNATTQDPPGLMKENCKWPGYYFVCYPDQ